MQVVGRFIVGFAVCLSATAECVYISEISPPVSEAQQRYHVDTFVIDSVINSCQTRAIFKHWWLHIFECEGAIN